LVKKLVFFINMKLPLKNILYLISQTTNTKGENVQ